MIRIGTRNSPLALWQANYVAKLLQQRCHQQTQIIPYVTEGDRKLATSLAWKGGKGLFIKDIQNALQEDQADIAVHSMKDVPIESNPDFILAAVLERASPYDVLISQQYDSLTELPQNAVIGTSSFRRAGQIKYRYPHFNIKLLRGNINTRINKCLQGEYDAIILAQAGIERLGLLEHAKEILAVDLCLPAIGQGAIGIECLSHKTQVISVIDKLNHPATRLCIDSEREFNKHLGGNCHSPVACFAILEKHHQTLFMRAVVTDPNGEKKITHEIRGKCTQSLKIAYKLAKKMIDDGALKLLT